MVPGAVESLALLALSLLFFIAIGIRQNALSAPDDQYWLAGRGLGSKELSATWSAGSLSLGLTILYYMAMTSIFGWKIFIISIFTYLLGQLLFRYVASTWRLRHPELPASVEQVISGSTNERALSRLAQYSGLFSLMAMLYAELFFSTLIINSILGNSSATAPTALFVLSIAVVSLYVLFGGMRAIVESDRWQLLLLYGAVATLMVLAITLLAEGIQPKWSSSLPFFESDFKKVDTISYFLFGLAANILPLLCQNSLWQMAASTRPDRVAAGAGRGIVKAFATFIFVILIAFVINGSGQAVSADVLVKSMVELGDFGSHFLLPLMFVGLLAAMLSTADNLLLGSALSVKQLLDSSEYRVWRAFRPATQRIVLVVSLALVQIIAFVVVTHILNREFSNYFLSLVFFLFSQAAPFGVVVLVAALWPNRLRKSRLVVIGVVVAWFLDFSAFLYATSHGLPKLQFFATPVAILISFAFAFDFRRMSRESIEPGVQQ